MWAIINKQTGIVKRILEEGSDVDEKDRNDWTALHYALSIGNAEIVRMLLKNGANVSAAAKNKDSFNSSNEITPLMLAILTSQNFLAIKELLDGGANTNEKDNLGNEALHYAARKRHSSKIVKLLLEAGADPSVENLNGETPTNIALKTEGNYESATILIKELKMKSIKEPNMEQTTSNFNFNYFCAL